MVEFDFFFLKCGWFIFEGWGHVWERLGAGAKSCWATWHGLIGLLTISSSITKQLIKRFNKLHRAALTHFKWGNKPQRLTWFWKRWNALKMASVLTNERCWMTSAVNTGGMFHAAFQRVEPTRGVTSWQIRRMFRLLDDSSLLTAR